MRNGFLHDRVLLLPLEACFLRQGAIVRREHHVVFGGRSGFIDLLVQRGGVRIAVEAELTLSRVPRDVEKAKAVAASALLIVTPNGSVAEAAAAVLEPSVRGGEGDRSGWVWILPLGRAIAWAERCFLMFPDAFGHPESNTEPGS